MKMPKLQSVLTTIAASTLMLTVSAGATPILSDSERSLEHIVCGLYMVEGTSCRQPFDGSDRGHSGLSGLGTDLERANLAAVLFS